MEGLNDMKPFEVFKLFEATLGLHINWGKSFIYPVNEVPRIDRQSGKYFGRKDWRTAHNISGNAFGRPAKQRASGTIRPGAMQGPQQQLRKIIMGSRHGREILSQINLQKLTEDSHSTKLLPWKMIWKAKVPFKVFFFVKVRQPINHLFLRCRETETLADFHQHKGHQNQRYFENKSCSMEKMKLNCLVLLYIWCKHEYPQENEDIRNAFPRLIAWLLVGVIQPTSFDDEELYSVCLGRVIAGCLPHANHPSKIKPGGPLYQCQINKAAWLLAMLRLTTKVTRRSRIAQSFGLGCAFWAGQGHGMPTSMRNAHSPYPERMKERC
ncbi:hypothetical protein H5410_027833 [Solanum commersonii]|uniref:Uncharacterized protein n=1 Tax=Solanum commersonii TaxID=4109 RepID=A0A9J5Z2C1_SOLCO|nr:hypothetical protein H5410_027833 [Solanum commersonii]